MDQHSQPSTKSELDCRIRFKNEYGIDYFESVDNLNKRIIESNRRWVNTLISHGVISN